MGLAGVAQVMRIEHHVQHVRKGLVTKKTVGIGFAVTSYPPEEASPAQLLQINRDHWSGTENGQFYRRDCTQGEDGCRVGPPGPARILSLFRSLAIFLFKHQSPGRGRKKSLPLFEQHVHRRPGGLIGRFTQARHEE